MENRDPKLWKMAQRRATFKYHALIYFIMNLFLWTVWYISLRSSDIPVFERDPIPWALWPSLGWGLGLFFHYLEAYKKEESLTMKEYDKLKNESKRDL